MTAGDGFFGAIIDLLGVHNPGNLNAFVAWTKLVWDFPTSTDYAMD